MSIIKFKKILSCSSEDRVHCAENLLKSDQNKKWLSLSSIEERIVCVIEFEKPCSISSIDIGNNGSAFIELLLSRASENWSILLPPTALMTPNESYLNKNRNQIKKFQSSELNGKWSRLKIICEQKYNHEYQFGLNFIKLYSTTNNDNENKCEIMKNIVLVISGFQNPLRSELRNKATSMGAICNEGWDEKCTHLICAFPSTPKAKQVEQTGKGFIVNRQWILDCYEQNQLLDETDYELKQTSKRTSQRNKKKEVEESTDAPKDVKRKRSSKKTLINVNEDEANKKMGEIPEFFHGKHFYVSYGDYNDETLLDITRVILAYDGILQSQITSDVTYVVTNRMWNQDFDKISRSNPDINFINLDWLQDCHDANEFVPIQSYLIVP